MAVNLPSSICSPQDLAAAIQEIQTYASWFSHAVVKKRAGSDIPKPPLLSTAAKELVDGWESDKPLSRQRLDSLIKALEDFKSTAPRMEITLAAQATAPIQSDLVAWCRQNLSPNTLVTFSFNKTLLGGMVVRFGSRMYDWSFRKALVANQDNFTEVLKRV